MDSLNNGSIKTVEDRLAQIIGNLVIQNQQQAMQVEQKERIIQQMTEVKNETNPS